MQHSSAIRERGWRLKPEVLQELQAAEPGGNVEGIHVKALDLDIRHCGYGDGLPDDITSRTKHIIEKVIVQASEVLDISRPLLLKQDKNGPNSVAWCQVTDGRITAHVVAFERAGELLGHRCPGTKILLEKAPVEYGIILIDKSKSRVLGGRVSVLAEAWETQQIYGGSNRISKDNSNSMGPAFSPFHSSSGGRICSQAQSKPNFQKSCNQPSVAQDKSSALSNAKSHRPEVQRGEGDEGLPMVTGPDNASQIRQKMQSKMRSDTDKHDSSQTRGRRNRRGRRRDYGEANSNAITMEEWEAQRSASKGMWQTNSKSDEQLARDLHNMLNGEGLTTTQPEVTNDLAASLFTTPLVGNHQSSGQRRGGGRGRRGRHRM